MVKKAFTLVELLIVITIVALMATFSMRAWSGHLMQANFNVAVNEIIGFFQDGRAYAMKNAQIGDDADENSVYTVSYISGTISLSGDASGEILSDSWDDLLTFDCSDWSVAYTAPYADFTTEDGGDLEFTVTSKTDANLNRTILVRASSGIAEVVEE